MFAKKVFYRLFAIAIIGLCLFAYPIPAKALTNTVSPTYPTATGGSGVSSIVQAPDGSTYVGGSFTMIGSTPRNNLARILADGVTVDPTFNPDVTGAGTIIQSMVLDTATNTLYFGGHNFTTVNGATTRNRLAAVNATTGVVTAFNPNIDIFGFVQTIALDPTVNILYVGGLFNTVNGGTARTNIAAFDTGTSLATAFNPSTDNTVNTLLLNTTAGTLYTGGEFTTVNGGTTRNHVAEFNTTTSVETAFDPNTDARVYALAFKSNTLYVGGEFTTVNGSTTRNSLAAFDATSSIATAFNPDIPNGGPGPNVGALLLNPVANTIFASGQFFTVNGGTVRTSIAEFDLATSIATSFDPVPAVNPSGSGGGVFAAALNSLATSLYIGGTFEFVVGGANDNLGCIGSCITAPPPGPPPTPPPTPSESTALLAPTGVDIKLPIAFAFGLIVTGLVSIYFIGVRKLS
jgi:hypothetical protein